MKEFRKATSEMPQADSLGPDAHHLTLMSSGSKPSFRALYDKYFESVYLYSMSIVKSEDAARDVSQEVWVALWVARSRIRLHTDSLLPWLLVTSRHKSLKRLTADARHSALPQTHDVADSQSDTEHQVELEGTLDLVNQLVGGMPLVDQQVFQLCLVDGLSYAEAAARIGVRHGVVRNRLSRLRHGLRGSLAMDADYYKGDG